MFIYKYLLILRHVFRGILPSLKQIDTLHSRACHLYLQHFLSSVQIKFVLQEMASWTCACRVLTIKITQLPSSAVMPCPYQSSDDNLASNTDFYLGKEHADQRNKSSEPSATQPFHGKLINQQFNLYVIKATERIISPSDLDLRARTHPGS